MPRFDPSGLDAGIQEIVLLLRRAGYKTFTSCEGGRGHPFHEPTVGLRFKGDYFRFRDHLVEFLYEQGRCFFEVTLVSSYHRKTPERQTLRLPARLRYCRSRDAKEDDPNDETKRAVERKALLELLEERQKKTSALVTLTRLGHGETGFNQSTPHLSTNVYAKR